MTNSDTTIVKGNFITNLVVNVSKVDILPLYFKLLFLGFSMYLKLFTIIRDKHYL